jgi:3-isopropylmalate/(R)-2-methylmalate dehydratase small subunit
MQAVTTITGIAAALLRENIDTDVIIPSREITSPARDGYAPKLFAPWRYLGPGGAEDPTFVLNQPPWRQASILISGANFGCGSSREMAVWALAQFGFRALIAPSFGTIFRSNCLRNGLLPVTLPAEAVAQLAAQAGAAALTLTVDLLTCEVRAPDGSVWAFSIDAHEREMLLTGLDAIDLTRQHRADIEAFEAADRQRRPWVWI